MSISEQVKYLRNFDCFGTVKQTMIEAADTIEALSAKLANMERSEDCGGWVLCEDKMPPDGQKVFLSCKYMMFDYVTVGTIINKNRGKSYIADEDTFMRSTIIAWQPLPEPYHEP